MDRVQDAEKTEEDNYELSLRPKYLREYIGQRMLKKILMFLLRLLN